MLRISSNCALGCGLALAVLIPIDGAYAGNPPTETVLYNFCTQANCADGFYPYSGLLADSSGNLYGTTYRGAGGTVFKLAPNGTETVLYSFCSQANCADGGAPFAGLIMDKAGNLYGTTLSGGDQSCGLSGGCGTVFRLARDGTEMVLYAFTGGSDGVEPYAGLIMDSAGNLYGTTTYGSMYHAGIVFKIAPYGTETVLHAFTGGSDGGYPLAGLIADSSGNLYGTTYSGGTGDAGIVFKLAPDGTETVIHDFGGSDGGSPRAGLIMDSSGNLYGTTEYGGAYRGGTVFKLAPDGSETILHNFCSQANCADGEYPFAGLIMDSAGYLYGTTAYGGGGMHGCGYTNGCGTIFELAPNGNEIGFYRFCLHWMNGDCADGASPVAGSLIMDSAGNLYGTTFQGGSGTGCGGYGCGTVFEFEPYHAVTRIKE